MAIDGSRRTSPELVVSSGWERGTRGSREGQGMAAKGAWTGPGHGSLAQSWNKQ